MSADLEPKKLVMSPYGAFMGIALDSFAEGEAVCSIAPVSYTHLTLPTN